MLLQWRSVSPLNPHPESWRRRAGPALVTRALRDALPAAIHLTATDLNTDMMNVAQAKVRRGEAVEFQPADGMALPFVDGAFDTVVCQFGMMFYPDKDRGFS